MSFPKNPLADYQSYSYYHVLVMCDSTATADALANVTDLDKWSHATPSTANYDSRVTAYGQGKYAPKLIKNVGRYLVLINGSTDAAYTIESAKWLTSTGAMAVPGDRSTSIAVEGSITISEPKGIAFLDQVVKSSVSLGVDSSQVIYVLKTVFVGYKKQGSEVVQAYITDIPPVNFIAYDVTGSFTESGGTYEMLVAGVAHGATRLPQYSKSSSSINIMAGDSLESTLKRLEDSINRDYAKYYDCVIAQVKSMKGASDQLASSLRKVTYRIEVADEYKASAGQNKYVVTNQPSQFKNGSSCADPAQIAFSANTSVETAISNIMQLSPQVQADMTTGDVSTGVKYEFKIHTTLESKRTSGTESGELDYIVHYRVFQFATPKTVSYDPSFFSDDNPKANEQYAAFKNNIIEFDYLYTGKNIDVLEFDMKLNMGLAYLQTATLSNTFKSQLQNGAARQTQPSTQDLNAFAVRSGSLVPVPLFFSTQIRNPMLTGTLNGTQSIQSAYTMTKHASLEVTDVSMRIVGNVQLLGSTNRITSADHMVKSLDVPSTEALSHWGRHPAYAKVNIRMPQTNNDVELLTGTSAEGNTYARDFWFDGYYYIIGIEHNFDRGEFTQTLQMLGMPKKSAFDASSSNAAPAEVDITAGSPNCYDLSVGYARDNTGPQSPEIPHTPPSGSETPQTQADATSVNDGSATSLSNVRGWDTASDDVKNAIRSAAKFYNVSEVHLAQICSHESKFKPAAQPIDRSGTILSTAVGLFQIISGTWNGLVSQNKIPPLNLASGSVSSVKRLVTSADVRTVPQYNALGGAAYYRDNSSIIGSTSVGDVYLAHFAGPGTARQIIMADRMSGGKSLVSSVLSTKVYGAMNAANPSIVNATTTVGSLRAWAARSMAATLINGVRVVAPTQPTTSVVPPTDVRSTAAAAVSAVAPQVSKQSASPCSAAERESPQE